MKLLSCMVFKWNERNSGDPIRLAEAMELSEFGFFKKGSIKEILTFVSRKVVNRSALGERSSVSHEEYVAHVRVNSDKLACVVVTDKEYPARVAHDVVSQAMKAFTTASKDWTKHTADTTIPVPAIDSLVKSYQKPNEVDKIMKIQKDVDEVKEIMMKNIDQMLDNNEKLEDLVSKSNDLSIQSKTFAKKSKEMNSCCR